MDGSSTIRIEDVRRCPLCGSEAKEPLYKDLRDHLYGVPGRWSYKRCKRCGLIFLDPRPTREDIGKAYAVYATHKRTVLPETLLRRFRSFIRRGYLANRFGYAEGVGKLQRLAGWLAYLHPGQREYINGSVMHLPANRRGRVLDVGAGSGATLNELCQLGWRVEGVDPDPAAVGNAARSYGLHVREGSLEAQKYPSAYFDAVITSHTIEHVHDPVRFLRECWRVLRPGGMLIVATPNADSLGSWYFKHHWRVLEPPRHLTVLSRRTLALAAREAGLASISLKTTLRGAVGIFIRSAHIRQVNSATANNTVNATAEKLKGHLYQYVVSAASRFLPGIGEELLLMAVKDDLQVRQPRRYQGSTREMTLPEREV